MKTFLFYDTETSGLNPAFDQILTFAAIRTDLSLDEIDKHSITIRIRKDIIPSPAAFLTHHLSFEELQAGICEYDAAITVHRLVNEPGTISLGYNSLGFDDEFLRFLFYRNLLEPYTHQYYQGCVRMDILPVTVIYRLFHSGVLKWPSIDGKPTLKLEHISRKNGFITSGRAHEAMSDVEAVIELCRCFRQNMDIWNYALDFFIKVKDEIRINNIKKECCIQGRYFTIGLAVSASFGSDNNYIAPVLHLGESLAYKNQSIWLRLDGNDVLGVASNCDISETMVVRKRAGDAFIILPFLERFQDKLTSTTQKRMTDNLKTINEHWARFFELIQYHREFKYPVIPDMDADASLYQAGFFSKLEKQECSEFHKADSGHKFKVVEKMQSKRTKQLAGRILFRNFEKVDGTVNMQSDISSYLTRLKSQDERDHFLGYKNDHKRSVPEALAELKEITNTLSNPTAEQQRMVAWLESYLGSL